MEADTILSVASLVAAGVLAVLTGVYVHQTGRLVRAQTYPNVIVFTDHDESRPTIIQIVVRNVGHAIARDVSFSFSRQVPGRAFGLDAASAEPAQPIDKGPLVDGIPALGPNSERRIDWGQYGGLKSALGEDKIVVTCTFFYGRRRLRPTHSVLEVDSYSGTVAVPSEGARIAKALEDIKQRLSTGSVRVEVTHFPKPPSSGDAA